MIVLQLEAGGHAELNGIQPLDVVIAIDGDAYKSYVRCK